MQRRVSAANVWWPLAIEWGRLLLLHPSTMHMYVGCLQQFNNTLSWESQTDGGPVASAGQSFYPNGRLLRFHADTWPLARECCQ